ncbi:MAG: acyl-CoA dehydrogenase, partial [Candidatus Rokubacteria bacterium]|nr:acyl-CoA dehydrogenase [Candidatus Rokubacteria bacterium]
PVGTLGLRGLEHSALVFTAARVEARNVLGGVAGRAAVHLNAARAMVRLGVAASAIGVAQAAFEAALRYSRQRTAFGKPIGQHQAIQLKLADMATRTTAARLLTYEAAERGLGDDRLARARSYAAETAYEVALESMRIHGGYGYTAEFPIERYYRDAAQLLLMPAENHA